MKNSSAYAICGPFPPPVHGMGKNLEKFYKDAIEKANKEVRIIRFDTSPETITRGGRYHLTKMLKVAKVLFGISKLRKAECQNFYMPPDAGYGALYSLLISFLASLKFNRFYYHHRSFYYIDKNNYFIRLLVSWTRKNATHIFLNDYMAKSFKERYGDVKSVSVSNAMHVNASSSARSDCLGRIRIGFLSNISFDKGIKEVVSVFEQLIDCGADVELIVGGPFEDRKSKDFLNEKIEKHGSKVKYLGYVSGEDKDDFYQELDFFVFPTKYRNEAQPNVLFEAASHGVVVLSTDKGCIKHDFSQCSYIYGSAEELLSGAAKDIMDLSMSGAYHQSSKLMLEIVCRASKGARDDYDALLESFLKE